MVSRQRKPLFRGVKMKKPIIAIFCKGNVPTKEEEQLIRKFNDFAIVLNTSTLKDSDNLMIDGVCGSVPSKYSKIPKADDVYSEYQQYLANLGNNVGGRIIEPIDPKNNEQIPLDNKTEQIPPLNGGNPPNFGFN